MTITKIMHIIN